MSYDHLRENLGLEVKKLPAEIRQQVKAKMGSRGLYLMEESHRMLGSAIQDIATDRTTTALGSLDIIVGHLKEAIKLAKKVK